MSPLERIEALDQQITELLKELPRAQQSVDSSHEARQRLHGALAGFWSDPGPEGTTRKQQLLTLHREHLRAEIDLRLADQTLDVEHARQIRTCLELPRSWQRRHLPQHQRPQVYRPLLECSRPNWRSYLHGALVITTNAPEGTLLKPGDSRGRALLYSLSHGIEAYASLAELHSELCERLDDPLQSTPLLHLLSNREDAERGRHAERLRYDWYAYDLLEVQIERLLDAQRQRLNGAWLAGQQGQLMERLNKAISLKEDIGTQAALKTRYSLLLEKHLPSWLRNTTSQGLSHIMQSMQELVLATQRATAPGILNLTQFQQRHNLLAWTRERLQARIQHDLNVMLVPEQVRVNITHGLQTGPHLNPLNPSSYVTWHGTVRVGDELVQKVTQSFPLDILALHNLPWFDLDYWLTARITHAQGEVIPAELSPDYVKTLIRDLNVGGSYAEFLYTQLIESRAGRWRLQAHAGINRARMRAEAAKARYAGHFTEHRLERGYRWVSTVLDYPDNDYRPTVAGHMIQVRQLLIKGHTLQGVLLISAQELSIPSFILYTPDAPDRRSWREFGSVRELLRALRSSPSLRQYVSQRLPLLDSAAIEQLLTKGRLGPHFSKPAITGELFFAYYMAEARSLLAIANASSRTTAEVNVQSVMDTAWLIIDLISLVLPNRAMVPLSIGRLAIDVWDGLDAYNREDREGVLRHAYNALSHANDAATSYVGSGFMRRALRGMPKRPPLPMPSRYQVNPETSTLRYRIDGIYGEGVYEKASAFEGLSQYFVQDNHGRYYKVSFDGQRWRVIDPDQPDAYLQLPLKRRKDGEWVIDSPVLWYEGLPDLQRLLDDCRSPDLLAGQPIDGGHGVYEDDGQLYFLTAGKQLPLRRHLLDNHYHLIIPQAQRALVVAWAVLRWHEDQWRIRVRQAGRSSDWLALPASYSDIRGSN
ncbi:dermonecrotic toxin domain-containing protein [Pseudomonas sp. UM16]|uniref:dermonecrotic toxin domain-containing protein n=1 Tax=Pseudomonas sp. UM16 TaxID=3158962 RepID=UPI00398FA1B8